MVNEEAINHNGLIVNTLASSLQTGVSGLKNIPKCIKAMLENQAWKKRYVPVIHQIVEFDSFTDFLEAMPTIAD